MSLSLEGRVSGYNSRRRTDKDILVSSPKPNILEITRGFWLQVKQERGRDALFVVLSSGAVCEVEITAFSTTDSEMRVPHAN